MLTHKVVQNLTSSEISMIMKNLTQTVAPTLGDYDLNKLELTQLEDAFK